MRLAATLPVETGEVDEALEPAFAAPLASPAAASALAAANDPDCPARPPTGFVVAGVASAAAAVCALARKAAKAGLDAKTEGRLGAKLGDETEAEAAGATSGDAAAAGAGAGTEGVGCVEAAATSDGAGVETAGAVVALALAAVSVGVVMSPVGAAERARVTGNEPEEVAIAGSEAAAVVAAAVVATPFAVEALAPFGPAVICAFFSQRSAMVPREGTGGGDAGVAASDAAAGAGAGTAAGRGETTASSFATAAVCGIGGDTGKGTGLGLAAAAVSDSGAASAGPAADGAERDTTGEVTVCGCALTASSDLMTVASDAGSLRATKPAFWRSSGCGSVVAAVPTLLITLPLPLCCSLCFASRVE